VGDRVAVECGVPCSQPVCTPCRTGRYNACELLQSFLTRIHLLTSLYPGPHVVFFSTPPFHGTLTRWHAHPAQWLHKLPDHVSYEEGSLCEPLAVALAGIERAGLVLGDPIVIAYVYIDACCKEDTH
jgi:L-iditol 2-dehydrogenase